MLELRARLYSSDGPCPMGIRVFILYVPIQAAHFPGDFSSCKWLGVLLVCQDDSWSLDFLMGLLGDQRFSPRDRAAVLLFGATTTESRCTTASGATRADYPPAV